MMRFFLFLSAVVNVVLGGFPGWTYRTTPGTCAGTTANPCGPVSNSISFLLFC